MPSIVMYAFEAPPHLKGSLALVHVDHLSICEVALYLHVSESIIGAPVAPALGVDAEVGALDSTCDVFKHTTSFKCGSHLGLPDDPVCFVKVSFKSYH